MMIRVTVLIVLTSLIATADDAALDRKQLKSGLVAGFTKGTAQPHTTTRWRLDPTVALLCKSGESMHVGQEDTAKTQWTGYLQIVTPGEYTFAANIAAGQGSVTLTLDQKALSVLVVKDATPESKLIVGNPTQLEPGYYLFQASYESDVKIDSGKVARQFELLWTGPGFQREPIPWFFFSHLPSQRSDKFKADQQVDHGRFLFEELACAKCHTPEAKDKFTERGGPNLTAIGGRAFPGWLDAWLADPAKLRPHTTMPKLFADTEQGVAERYAVTQYLVSLGGGPLKEVKASVLDRNYQKSLDAGNKLFTTTGCAACHGSKLAGAMKATDDDDAKELTVDPLDSFYAFGSTTGGQGRYALGGVGSKTTADALARYLKSPLHTNTTGRMPDMALSNDEARDLARHLMRFTDESIADKTTVKAPAMTPLQLVKALGPVPDDAPFLQQKPDEQWRTAGKVLFLAKGCANCHTTEEKGQALAKIEVYPKLTAIQKKSAEGCLSEKPKSVVYKLDVKQRDAMKAFFQSEATVTPSPAYETRANIKRFNCLNCHSKDGEGGIGTELAEAMKKADSVANEDDIAPPRLTGIGHKATTKWLTGVMLKGERARPWMPLRMPQYGEANVASMVNGLPACEGILPESAKAKVKPTAEAIDAGRKLVGKEGLGCVACHDISGMAGGGTRGPDLALTDARVRQEWYTLWMHNPQRLAPGTKMPQNFTDGKSVSKMLDADATAQIDAIWAYLSLGPGLPLPAGLEPPNKGLPLAVKDRPEILRTFMPDNAGTRPIAVGFPNGAGAYVFDSHACRLSYAWEGNFLDAAPVWAQRGGETAKLLGPKFLTAPPGQPWAVTHGSVPDYEKLKGDYAFGTPVPFQQIYSGPMRVHFDGYRLDTVGVPTFQYRVDSTDGAANVTVDDTPLPVKSSIAAGLKRSFVIDRPASKTVWLHVGTSSSKVRMAGDRVVMPQEHDKALLVTIGTLPSGATWEFVPKGDGQMVLLKIPSSMKSEKSPVEFTVWAVPRNDDALFAAIEPQK